MSTSPKQKQPVCSENYPPSSQHQHQRLFVRLPLGRLLSLHHQHPHQPSSKPKHSGRTTLTPRTPTTSFAAGDIITVIEETNADWWLGEHNGCRALFPANYVEKITAPAPAARTLPPVYIPPTGSRSVPPAPAPATTQKKELQQDPGQDGKKSKFGKYGNTMAHSAAGGIGIGAGVAIGGGLVRVIF
ncbi:uncharacterized protein EV420DRAFT_1745427 [Desarmillaria tabescens]|uniref:SH3 domain-containing protein n=1 Tax=Armillaria tabescens TaxID=1929756 RepID=A0AA39TY38_ARMTA|nr:uncharacterized protein EV420DRAFT_1745427 [Desarmillaria tabescens]KAK0462825.1 hypothetical protein EV420DRAFT_1745427 [Desarmillaria tabescens]